MSCELVAMSSHMKWNFINIFYMPYYNKDDINLLFIHIPKTGGTSIENYFYKKYDIAKNTDSLFWFLNKYDRLNIKISHSLQHLTYTEIFDNIDFFKIKMNDLKILTIVRNPYERLISDLFFYKKINLRTSKTETFKIIKQHVHLNCDNHTLPQYLYITDKNKKLIPNIVILHTENLTNDMHNLGYIDFNINENKNQTKNKNYYDYLNEDSISFINEYYDMDFKLFGYSKL